MPDLRQYLCCQPPWRVVAICLLTALSAVAQRPDPTMQLMLSQPPVDLSSPVVATAVVDPPVVPVGELVVYRITLNALEASVRWPSEFFVPPGLAVKPSASGQSLPLIANVQRPTTARNFHIRAERPGFYTLPAFEVEAYGKRVIVPETQLEVSAARRPGYEPARRLYVELAKTNAFVGEIIAVTVLAPGSVSNVVSGLGQIQFNGEGVYGVKSPSRQLIDSREFYGRRVPTVVYESSITPIAAGALEFSAQGFTSGMSFGGPVVMHGQLTIQGFSADNVLLDAELVKLNVQSLPAISDGQGFTGFIGALQVEPPRLSTNSLRVGDALRMLVTFSGDSAVSRLSPPAPPRVDGWQVYPASPADPLPRPPSTNAVVAFAYTLIPITEEVKHTPTIPFHIFDPHRGAYVNLEIPAVPVTVSAEGLPTNWVSEMAAMEGNERVERRPRLSELTTTRGSMLASMQPLQARPGFFLVQFGPIAGLLGWWGYQRRQRFLTAHPEIVRRRKAIRALRRERRTLHRAMSASDATGFARSAVTALQIAAAPHFPAEPRAIVCGDVLGLFDDAEQHGQTGEAIRRVFAQNDAAAFSVENRNGHPLFALKQDLDRILKHMEARL